MANAFQSGFQMGANIYNTAQEMKLREREAVLKEEAAKREGEAHGLRMDEGNYAKNQRNARLQAGEAEALAGQTQFNVAGQDFDTSEGANEFAREARRGIPTAGGQVADATPGITAPKVRTVNHLESSTKAANILRKAGLTTEAEEVLSRGKQKQFEEAAKGIVQDFNSMSLKEFNDKYLKGISDDDTNSLITSIAKDLKTGKEVLIATDKATGTALPMSRDEALRRVLGFAQMGAGDIKAGLAEWDKGRTIKRENEDDIRKEREVKVKEKDSESLTGLRKSQSEYYDANAAESGAKAGLYNIQRQVQQWGLDGIKENAGLMKQLNELSPEDQLGQKGKAILLKAASNAATKSGDYTAMERILMGSGAGAKGANKFDFKANQDGSWLVFDKQSGDTAGYVTSTGLMLPKGLPEADFNKEKQIAAKHGVTFGTMVDDTTNKVVLAYQGKDGRMYSTLEEARNPPKATGGVQANTTPAAKPAATPTARRTSPLSAAEQYDLHNSFTSKQRGGAPYVGTGIGNGNRLTPAEIDKLREVSRVQGIKLDDPRVVLTDEIFRGR